MQYEFSPKQMPLYNLLRQTPLIRTKFITRNAYLDVR